MKIKKKKMPWKNNLHNSITFLNKLKFVPKFENLLRNLYHTETNNLICNAKQLTGFYMKQVYWKVFPNRL